MIVGTFVNNINKIEEQKAVFKSAFYCFLQAYNKTIKI